MPCDHCVLTVCIFVHLLEGGLTLFQLLSIRLAQCLLHGKCSINVTWWQQRKMKFEIVTHLHHYKDLNIVKEKRKTLGAAWEICTCLVFGEVNFFFLSSKSQAHLRQCFFFSPSIAFVYSFLTYTKIKTIKWPISLCPKYLLFVFFF